MSAIMKLRQARNVEQIADELEPLAVSLATLADQAQASIKSMEAAALQQAREWNSQQLSAANEVEAAAKNVARGVVMSGHSFRLAAEPQQQRAGDDTYHRDSRDVD